MDSVRAQGACDPNYSLVKHSLEERDAMALSTKPEVEVPKNLPTRQTTDPAGADAQAIPTTGPMVKLTIPLVPSDQAKEEHGYNMYQLVTTSVRRLNLETIGTILGDMVTASARGVAFENPQMVAVLPGPTRGRRVVGNLSTTVNMLTGKDTEGGCP